MIDPVARWRPSASLDLLRRRAVGLQATRAFFAQRDVMEVETPFIVTRPVSEGQLANVRCSLAARPGRPFFLRTSPEFHMKRLLCAGAPDIFQIGKAFRDGELGALHLPEFTMVEWYRRGLGYDPIIGETCELIAAVASHLGRPTPPARRFGYRELLVQYAGVDPLEADVAAIVDHLASVRPELLTDHLLAGLGGEREAWLDLVMVEFVEPALRSQGLVVIDRYPAAQAALARLDPADPRVAERFEVYLNGLELANGYHELADAGEQRRRFESDNARRRRVALPAAEPDEALLAALGAGLPDCCGVALGFDRLLMACLGVSRIDQVVSFPVPEED